MNTSQDPTLAEPNETDTAPQGLTDGEALELEAAVSAHVLAAGQDPGLEILLEMAKRGEFDPWNVDVVVLTDRYLVAMDAEVNARQETAQAQAAAGAAPARRFEARDLSRMARLVFYAAAMIHLKAQALAEREARLAEERRQAELLAAGLDLTGDFLDESGCRLRPDDLPLLYPDFMSGAERGAMPLAPRDRPPRNRGLTLIDLIVALRSYDERLVEREALLSEMPVFDGSMALEECIGSAHEDALDQDIIEIRQLLWERLGEGQRLELAELVTPTRSRAAAYLALLFLSHDEEVQLEQEVFYGPLFVVRGQYFGQVRAGVATEVEVQPTADEATDDTTDDTTDDQDEDQADGDEAAETEEEMA